MEKSRSWKVLYLSYQQWFKQQFEKNYQYFRLHLYRLKYMPAISENLNIQFRCKQPILWNKRTSKLQIFVNIRRLKTKLVMHWTQVNSWLSLNEKCNVISILGIPLLLKVLLRNPFSRQKRAKTLSWRLSLACSL